MCQAEGGFVGSSFPGVTREETKRRAGPWHGHVQCHVHVKCAAHPGLALCVCPSVVCAEHRPSPATLLTLKELSQVHVVSVPKFFNLHLRQRFLFEYEDPLLSPSSQKVTCPLRLALYSPLRKYIKISSNH